MTKISFPGKLSQTELDKKRQEKTYQRIKRRDERRANAAAQREFNTKIGPAARIAIARRGLAEFAMWTLLAIGIGSAEWITGEQDKISYPDAFKRAYNIKNVATKDVNYTMVAWMFLAVAAALAGHTARKTKDNARSLVYELDNIIHNDWAWRMPIYTVHLLDELKQGNGGIGTRMNPVQRAVVKKYASENPTLFDNVLAYDSVRYGEDMNPDYAMTVIKTHLKKHPADYQKLLETYDETTLPPSLVRKYGGAKQR